MKRFLPLLLCLAAVLGIVLLARQPINQAAGSGSSGWFGSSPRTDDSSALPEGSDTGAIVRHFETHKLAMLQTYLREHPQAKDRNDALDQMAISARAIGDNDTLVRALELRLADYPTGPDLNVREYMLTASSLLNAIKTTSDKERFEKAHARIADAIKGNDEEPRLTALVQRMGYDLQRPWKGDELSFSGLTIDGSWIDISQWKGKVVLVDFWATWSEPCLAELSGMRRIYEEYHDKGLEIVSVSLDSQRTVLDAYLAKSPLPWPQICDGKGWQAELAQRFHISSIPASFLIGKDGKVQATDLQGPSLSKAVETALNAPSLP